MSFNSRTNVINDHVATSCSTSTIFEGCDYRAIIYSTIFFFESTIWLFNQFSTIWFCINSRRRSVYCISSMTICRTSFRCNNYILTSFYFCFSCFQLFVVDSITIICTRSYIHNLIVMCAITHGQVTTRDCYCRCISSTTRSIIQCDCGITIFNSINAIKVFRQLNK